MSNLNLTEKLNLDSDQFEEIAQSEKAYQIIRKAIIDLILKPGQQISETKLAIELNMSRTPVREAIHKLKNEDLIEIIPRTGSFVKQLTTNEIKQIYETAGALESMAAYLAALKTNEIKLGELLTSVETMEEGLKKESIEIWVMGDESYHQLLHDMCGNDYLVDALNRMNNQIHRARLMTRVVLENRQKSTKEHRRVYQLIRQGNAEDAREVMLQHWFKTFSRVKPFLLG